MTRPTVINLNPVELNYYPFMINLDKCIGSCNAVDGLSTKIYSPSKTKDIDVKVFNMITRINEDKTLIKHISCGCKCKFNSTTCNSNKKCNNDTCQRDLKIFIHAKKIIVGILAHIFVRIVAI